MLSVPWYQAWSHPVELQEACEKYLSMHSPLEYVNQALNLSIFLAEPQYIGAICSKSPKEKFDQLLDMQWNITHTVPSTCVLIQLQLEAFSRNMPELVKHIYDKYIYGKDREKEWLERYMPESSQSLAMLWHMSPMPKNYLIAAQAFIQDYKDRPEVHSDFMHELFDVPTGFEEAVAFSTKQVLIRIDAMKRNLEILKGLKSHSAADLHSRFVVALQAQLSVGDVMTMLHDLWNIRNARSRDRAKAATDLITALLSSLTDRTMALPKEIHGYLEGLEPFSLEWMYVKFRLIGFATFSTRLLFKNVHEKHIAFINSQDTLAFLVLCKIIRAMLPFSSKFCKSSFPYLINEDIDDQMLANIKASETMKADLDYYLNIQSIPTRLDVSKSFFTQALPAAFERTVRQNNLKIYLPLSDEEMTILLNEKKSKKALRPAAKPRVKPEIAIVEFSTVADSASSETSAEDSQEVPISKADPIEEAPTEISAPVEVSPTIDETKLSLTQSLQELVQPIVIDVDYDPEAAKKWEEIYQVELQRYASIKQLSEITSKDLNVSSSRIQVLNEAAGTLEAKKNLVALWKTGDFIELFPEAKEAYYQNVAINMAERAGQENNLRFRWIFDPSTVIDVQTYRFLCKVFGLLAGRKELNFLAFQKAFFALTQQHGTTGKNRTVFRFRHSFVLDGQVCVPPIGGVHPEHLSSRFNHAQVRKFLEHGGAHPYLFILLED